MEEQILAQLEKFERDTDWINRHYDELKEKYPFEFVAVLDEEVIDHSKSIEELRERLKTEYPGEYQRIVVEYLTPEEVDLIL